MDKSDERNIAGAEVIHPKVADRRMWDIERVFFTNRDLLLSVSKKSINFTKTSQT